MENMFSDVAGAIALIFVVLGALLLFPFFPMLSLCLAMMCILTTAVIHSLTDEACEEKGAERLEA